MNWRAWIYGLGTAVISAFSTAASGAIALPTVFSFTHDGIINMLKLSAVPAMLAFFAYLKQNPLPTEKVVTEVPAGSIVATKVQTPETK